MKNTLLGLVVLIVAVAAIKVIFYQPEVDLGSAPSGLAATVSTSSPAAVSTTASTIFATTSNCAARVITTYEEPIMLIFSDTKGLTPTATFGHLQTASTTVVYDGGIYGCHAFKAYSFGSVDIIVTETK